MRALDLVRWGLLLLTALAAGFVLLRHRTTVRDVFDRSEIKSIPVDDVDGLRRKLKAEKARHEARAILRGYDRLAPEDRAMAADVLPMLVRRWLILRCEAEDTPTPSDSILVSQSREIADRWIHDAEKE